MLNEFFEGSPEFFKDDPADLVWWVDTSEWDGVFLFSFDKKQIFNLFSDYPWALTPEQKAIFDRENPFWADFFSDRNGTTKEEYAGARAHERIGEENSK